jgi:hypothetical protein
MGGVRVGILGTDAEARARTCGSVDILGGGDPPGVLGVSESIPRDDIQRIVDDPAHTDHGAKAGADVKLNTTLK